MQTRGCFLSLTVDQYMQGQVRKTGVHTDFSGKERPRLLESGKEVRVGRHWGLWAEQWDTR